MDVEGEHHERLWCYSLTLELLFQIDKYWINFHAGISLNEKAIIALSVGPGEHQISTWAIVLRPA